MKIGRAEEAALDSTDAEPKQHKKISRKVVQIVKIFYRVKKIVRTWGRSEGVAPSFSMICQGTPKFPIKLPKKNLNTIQFSNMMVNFQHEGNPIPCELESTQMTGRLLGFWKPKTRKFIRKYSIVESKNSTKSALTTTILREKIETNQIPADQLVPWLGILVIDQN